MLDQFKQKQNSAARYSQLLSEKDERVLTPKEQAELIALANAEFDDAIILARRLVKKRHPELFDEHGQLKKREALTSLLSTAKKTKGNRKRKVSLAKMR